MTATLRLRKAEILDVIEKRHQAGDPVASVIELVDFMEREGSDLQPMDIGFTVAILMIEGRLRCTIGEIQLLRALVTETSRSVASTGRTPVHRSSATVTGFSTFARVSPASAVSPKLHLLAKGTSFIIG